MLILGIDTSGKSGGVTLAEGDERSFRVLGSSPIAGGTFSAQLVPTIGALLESCGRSLVDIGGFAAASGPGSFTGLRVGLSAVKGLAEILKQPIVTVSLLEALAVASGKIGKIATALDAGRSEIFFGFYQVDEEEGAVIIEEKLLTYNEFRETLTEREISALVTSDETVAEMAKAQVTEQLVSRPESALIARIGLKKLLAGKTVSAEALDANYIRRSDAEVFFKGPR